MSLINELAGKNTLDFPSWRVNHEHAYIFKMEFMEKLDLDRIHCTHALRDRKLTGGLLAYCLLIPLPILLMGHWQLACCALALCFVYVLLNPSMMMPSKAEVDEMLRAGIDLPKRVLKDNPSQNLSDKMHTELARQNDQSAVQRKTLR